MKINNATPLDLIEVFYRNKKMENDIFLVFLILLKMIIIKCDTKPVYLIYFLIYILYNYTINGSPREESAVALEVYEFCQ